MQADTWTDDDEEADDGDVEETDDGDDDETAN
jgi:hypothetical protein